MASANIFGGLGDGALIAAVLLLLLNGRIAQGISGVLAGRLGYR